MSTEKRDRRREQHPPRHCEVCSKLEEAAEKLSIAADRLDGTEQPESLYDTNDAAEYFNISRRKLEELISAEKLRPLRIGRKRLFTRTQLDAFLRRCAR